MHKSSKRAGTQRMKFGFRSQPGRRNVVKWRFLWCPRGGPRTHSVVHRHLLIGLRMCRCVNNSSARLFSKRAPPDQVLEPFLNMRERFLGDMTCSCCTASDHACHEDACRASSWTTPVPASFRGTISSSGSARSTSTSFSSWCSWRRFFSDRAAPMAGSGQSAMTLVS